MSSQILIVTHSGRFHADELLACAALSIMCDQQGKDWTIIRSRERADWDRADYVVDVGEVYDPTQGRFDHHQIGGAGEHANGIPYSSFGAVWKTYGETITGSREAMEAIENKIVYPIDAGDNGVEIYSPVFEKVHPYLFHNFVMAMNPTWKEGESQNERFDQTLLIMRTLLSREIKWVNDKLEATAFVERAYDLAEDKRLIVLEGSYPSADVLTQYPEPLFVVKPKSQGSDWEIEAVRNDVHTFANRKDLPKAWAGLFGEELAKVTGVSDAVFCHKNLFVAVSKSKHGALQLAQMALNT